ncbi:MAG: Smr/MutS family protein [Deltaproteobacteria bacterium]|nr:Smr/MutS family protein [Deltaproteobacteria bacterium]
MDTDRGQAGFEPAALRALEWPAVLDALVARCASPAAASRREGFGWPGSTGAIRCRLAEVGEAMGLLAAGDRDDDPGLRPPELATLPDVAEAIERAARSADLDAAALLALAALANLARAAAGPILLRAERLPALAALFSRDGQDADLPALVRLAADVDAVVAPDATIRDEASPEMTRIRRETRATRERVDRRLRELTVELSDHLQDRYVTERDGRPVMPVKVEAQSRVPGIVHGHSGSGATVFVEPREVVGEVNAVRLLEAAERRETMRLLRELSRTVEATAGALRVVFEGLVALDHRLAAARMALELRAVLPELVEEGGHELLGARHPLLALGGTEVVPNDIAIAPGEALVVAGPNAGGKTVAMKTLGLGVLLAHAGLPVPARAARIRLTGGVFCELGDEQSLALSLSSFSAHVSHLSRTLRAMRPGDLVLIDELAGGTDPAEGAALAVAVTRHLVSAGVAAVVTTHYEPLKRLSDRDPRVHRASMGMDPSTLEPTYRLHRGEVGTSAALLVAAHYGLPREVVADARGELPQAYLDSQERLARIAELHARAERDAADAASEKREVQAERARLVEELAKARQREHESIRGEVAGLWRQVHALRDELRTARKYLRETRRPTAEVVRKVEEKVEQAAEKLGPAGPVETALRGEAPGEAVAAERYAEGDTVYVVSVGREGILVDTAKDQAVVAFGSVKTRVGFGDLRRVKRGLIGEGAGPGVGDKSGKGGKGGKASASAARRVAAAADVWLPRTEANTIDLRGLRVDEALDRLDEQLDRMFQAEAGTVWVIHGHGTGAVRKAVREKLRAHPLVSEWRPGETGEGGDGVSLLRLK